MCYGLRLRVDDVGVLRRGWVVWISVGVVVLAIGAVLLWIGLDAADKVGSVVGALCGVVGLGLSVYGLVQARSGRPEERSVTNSITRACLRDLDARVR